MFAANGLGFFNLEMNILSKICFSFSRVNCNPGNPPEINEIGNAINLGERPAAIFIIYF